MPVRWVVGLLAVALWLPVPVRAATPVAPADLVGMWAGTWKNLKFGSTGTITANITQPDANTLSIAYDVTGGVFGCGNPSGTLTLVKGTDFTDTSVDFTRLEPILGTVTVGSLPKGNKLKGGGTLACGDGSRVPSWKFKSKYKQTATATKVTAKFVIKLAPKGSAKSTATITKQ